MCTIHCTLIVLSIVHSLYCPLYIHCVPSFVHSLYHPLYTYCTIHCTLIVLSIVHSLYSPLYISSQLSIVHPLYCLLYIHCVIPLYVYCPLFIIQHYVYAHSIHKLHVLSSLQLPYIAQNISMLDNHISFRFPKNINFLEYYTSWQVAVMPLVVVHVSGF